MRNSFYQILAFIFLINGQLISQQLEKPKVWVDFTLLEDNLIFETFEEDIAFIESSATTIFIESLNHYIGFASFSDSEGTDSLKLILDEIENSQNNSEFIVKLDFKDSEGNEFSHFWKFLDYNEWELHSSTLALFINKLDEAWNEYIKASYNQELVKLLFKEVAIPLPDSQHYFIDQDAGVHEAILPFPKELIRINPQKSQFTVFVHGVLNSGMPKTEKQEEVNFSGVVVSIPGIPQELVGCLRIGLNQLPNMQLQKGTVFITDYMHKIYPPSTPVGTNDFLSETDNN